MAVHTTTAYNDLVNLIDLNLITNDGYLENEAIKSGIFIKKNHPDNTGDTQRFEEFDAEMYAKAKNQSSNASTFRTQIGYSIDAAIQRKGFNVEYSYEFKNYEKYDTLNFTTTAALDAQSNRMDLDLQHLFTFFTSTSYVNMDGETVSVAVGDTLALGSTVHTLRASSSTYRSRMANNPQYSTGALELMEQSYSENCLNHFGQKQFLKADAIWSTDNAVVMNAIRRDLTSSAGVTEINSGVTNVNLNSRRHVVFSKVATDANGAPDTTKRNYWGICATGIKGFQAYYALNEPAHRDSNVEGASTYDVRKDLWSIPFRIGYSKAILSGRYFMGSTGDGTA